MEARNSVIVYNPLTTIPHEAEKEGGKKRKKDLESSSGMYKIHGRLMRESRGTKSGLTLAEEQHLDALAAQHKLKEREEAKKEEAKKLQLQSEKQQRGLRNSKTPAKKAKSEGSSTKKGRKKEEEEEEGEEDDGRWR